MTLRVSCHVLSRDRHFKMDDSDCCDEKYNRLGNCEVCGNENAQYTCPRCEIKTCSLNCVKIHKKELDCSGDRDKVGFVPMSKFNNLTLLSDYRLLEDVSRTVDNCKRNPLKKYTRFNKPLPPHLYKLRREALSRKTTLQFLPQHFTRHQNNTTYLHFETKIIHWKIQLIFYHADNLNVVIDKCNENDRLSTILSNYVDFDKCPDAERKILKYYHSTGLPGLEVLLKAENVIQQPSFFQLDVHSSLKENFEDKIIIEYPILYVIFKSHKDEFRILDPDMKVECNLETTVTNKKFNNSFMPFTYFDTVTYSKPMCEGDKAVQSINSCAAELRKYFTGCDKSDDDDDVNENSNGGDGDGDDDNKNNEPSVKKSNKINIPFYDNLIKIKN